MALDHLLPMRAREVPDRIALAASGATLTYAELESATKGREDDAGKPVAVSMPAGLDYAVELHALIRAGAVACPLDPRLTATEREAALEGTGTSPPGTRVRILTSGSSGRPRSIPLTDSNLIWSAVGSGLALGVEPHDRWLCVVPLFHVSGLMILVRSLVNGTAAEIHDGFELDRAAAALEGGEVTLVSLVATQLGRLLEAGADLRGPRAIVLGGGPTPDELLAEALARGATVVQTYGMTETTSQVATLAPEAARRKPGSAGRALLSAELRISGQGEILVRGPVVAPGSAAEDGWLHTGDLGRLDEDGYLHVTGRDAETIITGGENVMPSEVEAVLSRHPGVADAAVVGSPDPEWQEAVTALVVVADGSSPTEEELREHCAASLAPFKVPKRVEFVSDLPRTSSGKLRRHDLKTMGGNK